MPIQKSKIKKTISLALSILLFSSLVVCPAPDAMAKKKRKRSTTTKKKVQKQKKKIVKDPKKLEEGDNFFKQRKYVEAQKAYSAYIEGFPKDYRGYFGRAKTWGKLRNDAPAFYDMNKAISLETKKPELYFTRGQIQVRRGEFESALKDLAKATEKGSKKSLEIHKLKAYSYNCLGLHKKEVEERDHILEKEKTAYNYKKRAEAYYIMRDYEEAIKDYSKALESKPGERKLLLRRGYCYEKTKNWEPAIADYSEIIKDDPKAYRVFQRRATVNYEKGDYENALSDVSKAIYHFRGYNPKSLYVLRAKTYKKLGQPQKAAKDFAKYAKKRKKRR